MFKKYLCFCFFLLSIPPFGYPQQNKLNFTSLSSKDGLSSNILHAILKDRYGLMWFGTEDGLNKFDGTNFTIYRYKPDDSNGLQANEIRALHEDKSGNLWVGTSGGGISLYERRKNSFINFLARTNKTGLSNDVVRSICSDFKGKVWIGTHSGLDVLDPASKEIVKFSLQNYLPGKLTSIVVNCVFEDSKRRMWIATNNGLFLFDRAKNSFIPFLNSASNSMTISGDVVRVIVEDHAGNLWIGTTNGLSMLGKNGKSFRNFKSNLSDSNTLTSNNILSISADRTGQLWIGTNDGLNILNIEDSKISRYKHNPRDVYSLTAKKISCIYIDNQGISWLGTHRGGINKFDLNLNLFNLKTSNIFDAKGLNASVITSFAETKHGEIFIGTDGGGISLFNRKTGLFERITISTSGRTAFNELSVMSMAITSLGQLYVGTFSEGLFIRKNNIGNFEQIKQGEGENDLNSNDVFCLKEDNKGQLWVGTNGGGISVLGSDHKTIIKYCKSPKGINEAKYPLNDYIRFFEQDGEGNIWIGSYGAGIALFNPTTNVFTQYGKANSNLPNNLAQSVLRDSKGNMWVGTFSGGLSLFDEKSKTFTTFSENEGLEGTTVCAIEEDKNGQIWVSTNKGISSFNPVTRRFNNFTIYNGVQNNNFVRGAGFRSSTGEIFFGGAEGFNYFNPEQFKKNNTVPTILFTDLKVDNNSVVPQQDGPLEEHISVAKRIELNYKQNFALSFVCVNYTSAKQNRYSYRLEGYDKEWINAGTSKSVSYTNLDPGNYILHVRAGNSEGLWNNAEKSILINVKPPFWRTGYAYAFFALCFIGLSIYLRHRAIEKIEMKYAVVQEKVMADQRIEQERKETERLRELDLLKIKFLTNLSHEFRTPLSLIMGPVDSLLLNHKEVGLGVPLNMIKRNARRLLNLVNQILDFKKMEEQELKLHLSEGELGTFITEVLESFNDMSERKQIRLVFKNRLGNFHTLFDTDKIERILFNLLSNAFKFTPPGGSITVELEKNEGITTSDEPTIRLTIIDTGIGIDHGDQLKIFDRFFQSNSSSAILNQGSGIGLSITKEFVKMHGGYITVKSEKGRGSSFIVDLPFVPMEKTEELLIDFSSPTLISLEDRNEDTNTTLPLDSNEVPSVLLVEDNEDFRSYLSENLKSFYRVYEASNGREGWQKALSHHPQVIVSDVSMPYMDGIELCLKLKADKRTSHIPILLLTALTAEEEQLRGLETGANDYMTKPFNFEILSAKIKNLLQLNRTFKATYSKQIKLQTSEVSTESAADKLLKEVGRYIEDNLNNPNLSVEDLSKQIGMSRSSLYHKILELTGLSPVEYIRSVKLEKAAILLEKSDLNISQIAYKVGFATPNYFGRSFKAKFNMSASEFMNLKRKSPDNDHGEIPA